MTRIVIHPMDPAATNAADNATHAAYPITPSPGDADYGAFQKFWMDSYISNGGKYKIRTPADEQAAVKKARQVSKDNKAIAGASQECPENSKGGFGAGKGSGKAFKPGETPCTCKVDKLLVKCSHGRTAKNGLLQVVAADLAGADDIHIKPLASGSQCASKLIIRTNGFGGSAPAETKGPRKIVRPTKEPFGLTTYKFWKASPNVSTVDTTTCQGNSQYIRIERFPVKESKFNFGFEDIIKKFTSSFTEFDFDERQFTKEGTVRQIRRKGEAKDEDFEFTLATLSKRAKNNKKKVAPKAKNLIPSSFALASGWKEVEDGKPNAHLAYCEIAAILEAEPLCEWSTSILLYGLPIPARLKKYFAAGFYLNVKGKVKASLKLAAHYYPRLDDHWKVNNLTGELGGNLTLELEATIVAFSAKALQASAVGASGVSVKTQAEWVLNSKVEFKGTLQWDGIKVAIKMKAAWGLVDYEDEWPWVEPKKKPLFLKAFDL